MDGAQERNLTLTFSGAPAWVPGPPTAERSARPGRYRYGNVEEQQRFGDRTGEREALELADLRMRVRRGFLLRLRALFLESGAESATASAAEAHARALAARREAEALLERRERALEQWAREHGLKPTRRPSDLAGADRERREELERTRHEAHSDLQRTEVALGRARREVRSGGSGAGFSRASADDAQRAVGLLEGRLEEERAALERARERLWAFDAEHGVSSQPRRRVRDLSASERKRRDELRQSVRDAKQDLPDRPKPVPFDRLGAVYAEAEGCGIDDLPRTRVGVLSELEQYLEPAKEERKLN